MIDGSALWSEVKPILGPLIQAAVVFMVGAWTIWFQLRQARTAERKLFADLHNKRYKALSGFTNEVIEIVLAALDESDDQSPRDILGEHCFFRGQAAKLEELTWLFGDDVMFYVEQVRLRMEEILHILDRLRHNLSSDNQVELVESLNRKKDAFYGALSHLNNTARHYLYVGHIKTRAPLIPAFTIGELNAQFHPGRIR